jgi:L,D-transpeptidase-like protein
MPQTIHLNVILPKNRDNLGWLRVEVDGLPRAEFRVLGRGSTTVDGRPTGNPTLSPFATAGNTPTGDYTSPEIVSTAEWPQDSYGPWGALRLKAAGGDALLAERFGRTGLLIHGGAPGRFQGYRSTLGCLRLNNHDIKQLTELLFSAGENSQARMSTELSVNVTVREF